METPELKPCPFCGSENVMVDHAGSKTPYCWAYCADCGACGETMMDAEDAAAKWNTRAEVKAEKRRKEDE